MYHSALGLRVIREEDLEDEGVGVLVHEASSPIGRLPPTIEDPVTFCLSLASLALRQSGAPHPPLADCTGGHLEDEGVGVLVHEARWRPPAEHVDVRAVHHLRESERVRE